jgi:DNA repair protein RadC
MGRSPEAVARIAGSPAPAEALAVVANLTLHWLRRRAERADLFAHPDLLMPYLRAGHAGQSIETVRVLFLDCRNMLMRDELVWTGTVDESCVYVREIMRRALEVHAAGLIVVHNHPSGDCRPSPQDIALTRDLSSAGRNMSINVFDHYIISSDGETSLRHMGLM